MHVLPEETATNPDASSLAEPLRKGQLKNILFPTDLSEESRSVFPSKLKLCSFLKSVPDAARIS
jgi:hypothetical protein